MTLQFNPEAYSQIAAQKRQAEQQKAYGPLQSAGQAAQSIGGIGQQMQAEKDKKKQEDMNNLLLAMKAHEAGLDYTPAGQQPSQPDQSQQDQTGQAYTPNFQPQSSQFPNGMGAVGTAPQGQGAQTATPYSPSIQPQSSQFPGGLGKVATPSPLVVQHVSETGFNPLGVPTRILSKNSAGTLSQSSQPIDQSRLTDPNYLTSLPEKQRGIVEKQNEFNIRQQELNQKQSDKVSYSAQDVMDAEKGNWNSIAQRNGGKIPPSLATLGESATSKQDTAYEKKRLDAQNAMINVRGDQSIARTEAQRDAAALAYNTIERVKSENRLPSKLEYYDLLGQMWKARTGASPTDQALRDLDQKTLQGDIGKVYTLFSGKPAPATTQGVLQNLQNFVAESGVQAEKQHEAYMAPRQSKILSGLKPEDQQNLMNVHRGMSFQEQTGYNSPKSTGGATLRWNPATGKTEPL